MLATDAEALAERLASYQQDYLILRCQEFSAAAQVVRVTLLPDE